MIQFPSFMCYAVTALRVLSQAPWTDHMFHGHIRELILCAIGNGWTWTDQSATVQHRRVSVSEVCAAIASYSNQTAFPPGQVADLDTAIIEVCDDLYPEHCELFFPSISMGHLYHGELLNNQRVSMNLILLGGDWNMNFIFHFIYGMSSFPLTNIFQRG